jgi:radical SAM protein with 4Fe4S-binding SPASM domain
MRVNLISNGTLIDAALASELADAGLNSAQISIEAPCASVHDRLTQVQGSWDRSVRGLRALLAAGIHVHTNTTLNGANLDSALEMPLFAHSLGLARFSMNLIIPSGSTTTSSDLALRYTEAAEWIARIQQAARQAGVEFMWYSPTPVCIFNPIKHQLGNKGCAACDGLLSVSPTGDVLPCSSWPEPVGNFLKEDFRTVWDSARGRWLREKRFAHEKCAECEEFALCQGGCPLYWQRFGYEELFKEDIPHVAALR